MLVEELQVGDLVMKESGYLVNLDRDGDLNDRYDCEMDWSGSGCSVVTECYETVREFRILKTVANL
jgi:hypothetical protein